jgi:hypothetical protein
VIQGQPRQKVNEIPILINKMEMAIISISINKMEVVIPGIGKRISV